jgi:zinc transporter 1/2/3
MDQEECFENNGNGRLGLRIGGIFVVLVTSFVGTLAPILLKRRAWCPVAFFE